jgi:hypothetical protein
MPMAGISALANGNEFTITYEFDPDFTDLGASLGFPKQVQTVDGEHEVMHINELIGGSLPEGYTFLYWVDPDEEPLELDEVLYLVEDITLTAEILYTPPVQTITVNVAFYDTWNAETITVNDVEVPAGGTVTAADVADYAPEFWVSTTQQVTDVEEYDNITFYGSRLAQPDGDDYVTYTNGTRYQVITTVTGFLKIDDTLAGLQDNYLQYNDLNLTGITTNTVYGLGTFTYVCTIGGYGVNSLEFSGIYDGGMHEITGFGGQPWGSNDTCVGLFSYNTGTIKNINLTIGTLKGAAEVGGVVGWNAGAIENVHVTINNRIEAYRYVNYGINVSSVGGICGVMTSPGSIVNCSVKCNGTALIKTYQNYGGGGGICGVALSNTSISLSWFNGRLNSEYAYSYGGNYIGGIVGYLNTNSTVSNCWAFVQDIHGYDYLGGIAGYNKGTLTACWAYILDATGYYSDSAGSIVTSWGNLGTVTYCYKETADATGGEGVGTNTVFGGTTPLAGFDTSIWEFEEGYFPGIMSNPSR